MVCYKFKRMLGMGGALPEVGVDVVPRGPVHAKAIQDRGCQQRLFYD
jgi:hypothetical protein